MPVPPNHISVKYLPQPPTEPVYRIGRWRDCHEDKKATSGRPRAPTYGESRTRARPSPIKDVGVSERLFEVQYVQTLIVSFLSSASSAQRNPKPF